MMFQSLKSLLAGGNLTLSLTGNADDTITVLVVPKGEGALAQPLVLTATAAELDNQFADCISSYASSRKSLAEQMEATAAVIAAAKQESATKAVKAITKSATASTVKDKSAVTNSDPEGEENDDSEIGDIAPVTETASAAPPIHTGNLFP